MKRTNPFTTVVIAVFFAVLAGMPARSLAASIEGRITNGTAKRPLAHQKVDLINPQGGMAKVGMATTNALGHFVFTGSQINTNSFYLVQVTYEGVDYNAPVKFEPDGHATVNITAYESTARKPALRISSARMIVRAEGSQARVQELFAVQNPIQKAYRNPKGTFAFHIPSAVGNPTVAAIGLMDMPLPQNPESGRKPGDFYVTYPLKPGINVMMVAYNTDYSSHQLTLDNSVAFPIGSFQLFVIPPSLKVKSKMLFQAGQDSQSGAQVYEAGDLKAGAVLAAQLSGKPAAATQQASADQGQAQEQSQEQVKVVPASITSEGILLIICFLLILLWALGIRVSKEWPRWKAKQHGSPVQKQFRAKMETLINSIADIDELFASGKIAEKQYWKERLELKAKAVAILKEGPSAKSKPYATRKSHQ